MAIIAGAALALFTGTSYRNQFANYWCRNSHLNNLQGKITKAAEDIFDYKAGKDFNPDTEMIEAKNIMQEFKKTYHKKGSTPIGENSIELSSKAYNYLENRLQGIKDRISHTEFRELTTDWGTSPIISWFKRKINTPLFTPIRWCNKTVDSCWEYMGSLLKE